MLQTLDLNIEHPSTERVPDLTPVFSVRYNTLPMKSARLYLLRACRAALLALLAASAAPAAPAGQGPTQPRAEIAGYSIIPPAGWKKTRDGIPGSAIAFVGPVLHGFAVNLTITADSIGKVALAPLVADVRRQTPAAHILDDRDTTLDGVRAHRWTLQMRTPGQPDADELQEFAIRAGHAYVITLSAPPAALPKYAPVFERVLASFEWAK